MTSRDVSPVLEQTRGAGNGDWGRVFQDCIGTGEAPTSYGSALALRLWEEMILARSALLTSSPRHIAFATSLCRSAAFDAVALPYDFSEAGSGALRICWTPAADPVSESDSDSGLTERVLAAVTEICKVFELTSEEACRVGGFSRRNLSHWAADKTPRHSTVRHLFEAETFARAGSDALGVEAFRAWLVQQLPRDRDLVSVLADSKSLRGLVRLFADENAAPVRIPAPLSDMLELEADDDASRTDHTHVPRVKSELRHPRRTR